MTSPRTDIIPENTDGVLVCMLVGAAASLAMMAWEPAPTEQLAPVVLVPGDGPMIVWPDGTEQILETVRVVE